MSEFAPSIDGSKRVDDIPKAIHMAERENGPRGASSRAKALGLKEQAEIHTQIAVEMGEWAGEQYDQGTIEKPTSPAPMYDLSDKVRLRVDQLTTEALKAADDAYNAIMLSNKY